MLRTALIYIRMRVPAGCVNSTNKQPGERLLHLCCVAPVIEIFKEESSFTTTPPTSDGSSTDTVCVKISLTHTHAFCPLFLGKNKKPLYFVFAGYN